MQLTKRIDHLRKLASSRDASSRKTLDKIINLLEELIEKNRTEEENEKLLEIVNISLEDAQSGHHFKASLRKLRKSLMKDFGYVPPNYYLALGIGLGLALGTSIGISMGVPFEKGIIFGPMIGSGVGLLGGLVAGRMADQKKAGEGRVLQNL